MTGCFFNKHGRLRRRRASKARNTCPPSPSYTCSPPSGTPFTLTLSAGYARPKGLAHPRLSIVGPLRGPMYAHRAGDHKGRPYRRQPGERNPRLCIVGPLRERRRHGRGDPCGRPHDGETCARRRGISPKRATTRVAPTVASPASATRG